MTLYHIEYVDPNTQEWETVIEEFQDWTGRATTPQGEPVGPVLTITAEEWAHDRGYTLADKGPYWVIKAGD